MKISFFEEFPDEKTLGKIKLIKFPTKLIIAAKSVKDFEKIKVKNVKETIYWPILDKKEGYWLSPFSKRTALLRTIKELENSDCKIMWDAELPTRRARLFFTESNNFFRNRKTILEFFRKNGHRIYVSETMMPGFLEKMAEFLCVNFSPYKYKNYKIKMCYTSMRRFNLEKLYKRFADGVDKYGDHFLVAFGTIAVGILGNEPRLKADKLARDIKIADKAGVKEIVIFRLGGLDKEYAKYLNDLS